MDERTQALARKAVGYLREQRSGHFDGPICAASHTGAGAEVVGWFVMPPQDPLTRLREVALGLDALADELRELLDENPPNLRWWSREILVAVRELEAQPGVPFPPAP